MTLLARVTILLAALAIAGGVACAQKPESAPKSESAPTTRANIEKTYLKGDVIYLIGVDHLKIGDLEIWCEVAVIWLAKPGSPSDPKPIGAETRRSDLNLPGVGLRASELYAEGNVHLRQREEVHDAHSVFIDFVHERGLVVDPRSRFPVPTPTGQPAKLHVKAAELRILSETNMQMIGAQVSTCPFGNPHYHLDSDTVDLFRARASGNRPPGQEASQEPIPTFYYTASGNTLYVGFQVSRSSGSPTSPADSEEPLGKTYRHIKDVRFGKSGEFGTQIGLSVGSDLKTKEGTEVGHVGRRPRLAEQARPRRRRRLRLRAAVHRRVRSRRPTSATTARTSSTASRRTTSAAGSRGSTAPGSASEFQLDLEANLFSDRGYYPTYFESEFKTEQAARDVRVPEESIRVERGHRPLLGPRKRLGDDHRVPPQARLRPRDRPDRRHLQQPALPDRARRALAAQAHHRRT